jgi:hypothetical protein
MAASCRAVAAAFPNRNAAVEPASPDCHITDMAANPQDIPKPAPLNSEEAKPEPPKPREIGGPKGPEPTRYGDWEVNGRCTDF